MRYRLLLSLLVLFCGINMYANYISPYDFRNIKQDEEFQHIADPQKLLTQREIYILNEKLKSINSKYRIDITVILIQDTSSDYYKTGYQFTTGIHDFLRPKLRPDTPDHNLIITYIQKSENMGYLIGHSIKDYALDSLLVKLEADLNDSKTAEVGKSNIYPVLSKFITNIVTQVETYNGRSKDRDRTFYLELIQWTFIILGIWSLIIGIVARIGFKYKEDLNNFLNLMLGGTSIFSLIIYPFIIYLTCSHSGYHLFEMPRTLIIVLVVMLLGWLPIRLLSELIRVLMGDIPSKPPKNPQQTPTGISPSKEEEIRPRININRASFEELIEKFDGLHPRDADQIITARRRSGLFENIEDLRRRARLSAYTANLIDPYVYFFSNNGNRPPATPIKTTTIDINTATVDQIKKLSNLLSVVDIKKILQEREQNGYFKDIKDFEKRSNIPIAILSEIRGKIHFEIPNIPPKNRQGKRVLDL